MSEINLAKSLKESAEAAFDELSKEGIEPEENEEVEEPEEELEEEQEEADEEESEEGGEEEPEKVEEPESEPEEELGNEDANESTEDPRLKNPPTTWTATAKSKWKDLDPTIKAEIRKREDDAMRGLTNYKEKAEFGERMDKTIQPYSAFLKSKGIKPEQAFDDALNLAYTLSTSTPQERGAILKQLAQHYQADLSVATDTKQDPQLQALMNEIRDLKRTQQTNLQMSEQQQSKQIEQEIYNFATETDDQGVLKHPYFDNVQSLMASIIETNQAQTLEDAYEIAVRAHPETRSLASLTEKPKQEVEQRRKDKEEKNKRLNAGKKPRNEPPASDTPRSMRETIEKTYESLTT